ncbi:MAG: metallophosphoesterase [Nitrospirota bacterium]|jgi:predicted MPP superfamily phosphohydrolase
MRLFLIGFFAVYVLMHLYAFIRSKASLGLDWSWAALPAIFMAVMVFAPLIVWFLEKQGLELAAMALSHLGYMWLGLIFLFVSISIPLDIYLLLARGAGSVLNKNIAALSLSSRGAFLVPFFLALALLAYGYFDALNIRTERLTIETQKLPPGVERLRIVQISDIHVGLIVREERLGRILGEVRRLEPDILVATGDIVDGQINRLSGLAGMFREIKPRYGKYAITGNHEFYAGLRQALAFIEDSGFEVLRGEAVSGVINVAGVEDSTGRYFGSKRFVDEGELLSGLPGEKFTLLLKHRPEVDEASKGLFDLQLSGHTHKGQIFPFYLATLAVYPASGRHDLAGGSVMYLSRGTGTWGPPVRVFAPPEVTLIELVRK